MENSEGEIDAKEIYDTFLKGVFISSHFGHV